MILAPKIIAKIIQINYNVSCTRIPFAMPFNFNLYFDKIYRAATNEMKNNLMRLLVLYGEKFKKRMLDVSKVYNS